MIQCSILHDGKAEPAVLLKPARAEFPHLRYPPFFLTLPKGNDDRGDLRMDGLIGGKVVITRTFSSRGIDQRLEVTADDLILLADGSDSTRFAIRVADEYGAVRPLCDDPVTILVEGAAVLIGRSPVALSGGTTAVWVRTAVTPGAIAVTVTHANLGSQRIDLQSKIAAGLRLEASPQRRPRTTKLS